MPNSVSPIPPKGCLYLYDPVNSNYRAVTAGDFGIPGLELARGNIPGQEAINKFGRNPTGISNAAIWGVGTAYVEPTGAMICTINSTHTGDSRLGQGGHMLYIKGINENYDAIVERIPLSGTASVLTTGSYMNIHRAYITSGAPLGSGLIGTVNIRSTAVGTPSMSVLLPGLNQSQSTVYTIPRNYTAYLNNVKINVQPAVFTGQLIDISLMRKEFGGVFRSNSDFLFSSQDGSYQFKAFSSPLRIEQKSTIFFKILSTSTPCDVGVDYDLTLVAN